MSLRSFRRTGEALALNQSQLRESQRQFAVINDPILQIEFEKDNEIYTEWPKVLRYRITNLGRFPVRITIGRTHSLVDYEGKQLSNFTDDIPQMIQIVIPDKSSSRIFEVSPYIEDSVNVDLERDLNMNYGRFLYFGGYYNYVNMLNGETYMYTFLIRINNLGKQFEVNENTNIDSAMKLNPGLPPSSYFHY